MSIHPKHGKPKVSIQPQLVLSKPKDSSPVVRFQTQAPRESMDQTKREHLPNPQNNQIIELHLIMKTDQKFHHCYPKYPTHVFKWIVPEGPLVGPLVGPGPKKTAWCCVRSCSKADDLNGWTSPTISSWAIDGGSWLFMAIHCYWDTMIFNISSI